MRLLVTACQLVVALGIFNVWVLRPAKATPFRGGNARNIREEFKVYGLPGWFTVVIGVQKLSLATLLLAGLWFPTLTRPAAIGLAVLMLGAVSMHVKVSDPLKKALPSVSVLVLCLVVAFG
jgi:hypothetical protein